MIESPKWLADNGGRVFDVPYSEIYGEEEDEGALSVLLCSGPLDVCFFVRIC